jgi:hypothetical protein
LAKSQDLLRRIAMSLQHINMITGSSAGPIGGGQAHGSLWSEYGSRTKFDSKDDIQEWLNERLAIDQRSVDLSTHQLRLCHLDVAPRNLLILPDDKICFLDWRLLDSIRMSLRSGHCTSFNISLKIRSSRLYFKSWNIQPRKIKQTLRNYISSIA